MDPEEHGASETSPRSILLHVVSPSAEAQKLTFPDTPVTTTVAELKQMIQGAVASRPAPERQRLIYQGRPLLRPEATVASVLNKDTIDTSESFTFHLVLPPAPTPAPASAGSTTTQGQSSASSGAANGSAIHGSGLFGSQPGVARTAALDPSNYPRLPFGYTYNPNQPGAQHPNPYMQQPGGNYNPFAGQHGAGTPHQPHQQQAGHTANIALPPNVQQALLQAQQQQAAAQARRLGQQNGVQGGLGQSNETSEQDGQTPNRGLANTPTNHTIIREGQIPGGHFRMVVNQTTIPLHRPQQPNNSQQQGGSSSASPQPIGAPAFPPPGQQPSNDHVRSGFGWRAPAVNPAPGTAPAGSTQQTSSTFPTTVYLLSSPSGYQGLVMGPSGSYASNGLLNPAPPEARYFPGWTPSFTGTSRQVPHSANPFSQPNSTPSSPAVPNMPNVPPTPPVNQPAHAPAEPANPEPAQQNANNEANDLVRILIPIGGHLWVALRLLGVIWLLTHGSSWTRTILTCIVAAIFILAQTGVLNRPAQAIATPVMRHLENLLRDENPAALGEAQRELELRERGEGTGPNPPAAADPQGPDQHLAAAAAGADGERGDWHDTHGNRQPRRVRFNNSPEPSPQQAARRLLQQRREQDIGWARAHVRRAERALFLFAASLIPGVGELQVHAREEADRRARARAEEWAETMARVRRRFEEEGSGRGEEGGEAAAAGEAAGEGESGQGSAERSESEQARGGGSGVGEERRGLSADNDGLRNRQGHAPEAEVD